MGLFVRKGIRLGPLRLNISKSGVGVSAGVRGARVGITSQGKKYLAGGVGGLYVRESIGSRKRQQMTKQAARGVIAVLRENPVSREAWALADADTRSKVEIACATLGLGLADVLGFEPVGVGAPELVEYTSIVGRHPAAMAMVIAGVLLAVIGFFWLFT